MARWRLTAKHYINATRFGEQTQWVSEETSRETGRVNRKVFIVPMYLDPDSPMDQNYPGEVVVAKAKGAQRADIIVPDDFIPTMDMEPLDEEAEEINKVALAGLSHPIDDLPASGETYADGLLMKLTAQLEDAIRRASVPVVGTPAPDVVKKMQDDIKLLMDANAKLQAQLQARPLAK